MAGKRTDVQAGAPHLTKTERAILDLLAGSDGGPISKHQMAARLDRNEKTIDRLVSHLREMGLVTAVHHWDPTTGGQLPNTYVLCGSAAS